MPASNIDLYHMQDARNNFDAMRPAPVCADANQYMGQCQNVHISTNCYYGYHDPKTTDSAQTHVTTDCEMLEEPHDKTTQPTNPRKRSADEAEIPQIKRFREEVQKEKSNEPETYEMKDLDKNTEDLLECLYWNTHDDSPMCSLVGTRSSPSHSASAFNINITKYYVLSLRVKLHFTVQL